MPWWRIEEIVDAQHPHIVIRFAHANGIQPLDGRGNHHRVHRWVLLDYLLGGCGTADQGDLPMLQIFRSVKTIIFFTGHDDQRGWNINIGKVEIVFFFRGVSRR